MKRLLPLLVVFLVLLFAFPYPSQAQAGITVLSSTVEAEFPTEITFNLEVESSADISEIVLQYRVEKMSFVTLISSGEPDFTPAPRVETAWTWDMRKTGGLPPGAEIEYKWLIEDVEGNELETSWTAIRFDDHRYSWRSLTSGRVTLLWYSGGESFAQELMDSAQQALEKLARDTGAHLERPARIYVYADYENLRGAMVFPQEWTGGVAYPEYGIIAIGISPENLAWGKRTVAHELAHVVIHQITFNPYSGQPTWLDEGLAMYAEGEMSLSDRSRLEEATSEGRLFSVRSLSSSFPADPEEALLCYAQSYSVVEFLIASYGSDEMLQLLEVFSEGSRPDDALEEVYGFDMDGLDAQWRASIGAALIATPTPALTLTPSPTPTPHNGLFGCLPSETETVSLLESDLIVPGVLLFLPGVEIVLRRWRRK